MAPGNSEVINIKPPNTPLYVDKAKERKELIKRIKNQKALVIMSVAFVIYIFIFNYLPLWGWIMAFQNFKPFLGIWGSKWVGFQQFKTLFEDKTFLLVLRNTLAMSFLKIIFGYFSAITLAIILNEVKNIFFKRTVQTISYLPHFVSWVVAANIIITMLSTDSGVVNTIFIKLGILKEPVLWLAQENLFWLIIAITDVWKEVGWNAIIYLAAMTAISPDLYEAASIDGAGRIKRIFYITIPGIMPTVSVLLIMQCGFILNAGFEQQYLLANPIVTKVSDVLDIYVIKYGIELGRMSLATAAGIFKTVVSIVLLYAANSVAKRFGQEKLI